MKLEKTEFKEANRNVCSLVIFYSTKNKSGIKTDKDICNFNIAYILYNFIIKIGDRRVVF